MTIALRDLIKNPTTAELELVARFGMQPEDARRERAFQAFAGTGLPHRRMEAWKWSDFKSALKTLETPGTASSTDPLPHDGALVFRFTPTGFERPATLPDGMRMLAQPAAQAVGGAEDVPLGALAAALAGGGSRPATLTFDITSRDLPRLHFVFDGAGEASFVRVVFIIRNGAAINLTESYLGGAGFTAALMEFSLEADAQLNRTIYQRGGRDEALAVTSMLNLESGSEVTQTTLAFGAKVARLETRAVHQGAGAKLTLNAAYLSAKGFHADITTNVRHGAPACVTRQLTKGAVLDGGKGVFQGKFFVPRKTGQQTDADMQHQALLLEDGAEVFAKPELEIYADDVECAHGNTCGALDDAQLFYLRQRGIPEWQARGMLTEAFIAEALSAADESVRDVLLAEAQAWLSS
ncbi:SufD family Fe-S cluster assembly protein [Hyphomonas sp.]|uniref:SufB/SufD family protein n=1 Tax=Hyphomonas sp. TaxID=87 RepID=UPI0032EB41BE